jgi:soluble lytic murein transglycosylase-like protein
MKDYLLLLLLILVPFETSQASYRSNSVYDALQAAAETNHVPLRLLTAVCMVESRLRPHAINPHDKGSPSYGLCQLKLATAQSVGFIGRHQKLYNPFINAYYAAKYLRLKYDKYGHNWVKAVSAYNGAKVISANADYINRVFLNVLQ